jgi:hypothetical protein
MKKTILMKAILVACTLMFLVAGLDSAAAGGVNLGWDDCGGLPASLNKTSLCNTNVGSQVLIGSLVAPCCITKASGCEIVMDVQSTGASLPDWWRLRTGLCRSGSLSASFSFTAGPFTCFDPWKGGAFGALAMDAPVGNRARIKGTGALPSGSALIGPITEGTEAYIFKATINNLKTTGLGACAGCGTGVCIVLQSIKIIQPSGTPAGNKFIGTPATRAFATWQGGIGVDCYAATPVRDATWGSIKAIYR